MTVTDPITDVAFRCEHCGVLVEPGWYRRCAHDPNLPAFVIRARLSPTRRLTP